MNNPCTICPNKCKINKNEVSGKCLTNGNIKIAKYYLHPFEEPCISGTNGSGTIFFCGCSLKCVFCQNYPVSRNQTGKVISVQELADIFKSLEQLGAHNINLVNPTHYVDKILLALDIYKPNIPIVYNSHGYENIDTVKKIFDKIDIFMPDIKFFSPLVSKRYTGKENYFEVASKAIELMATKPLEFNSQGLMTSGTLVRHLILPMNTSDSKKIIDWFSTIKDNAYINLMSQYTPFGDIENLKELQRKITKREYESVINYAIDKGIEKAFYQTIESANTEYIPTWDF